MISFAPKQVKAESDPCATIILCGEYVTVCQGDDITPWVKLLCDKNAN